MPQHMMTSIQVGRTIISLIEGDITKQSTDAIVNAANGSLMGGGGVDGAIHRAGGPAILADCEKIVTKQGRLPTGEAVITTAGNLPSKYVIHTVGPIWRGGTKDETRLLRSCYLNSLILASENGVRTVSFPSVSTGAYGYPVKQAAEVGIGAVRDYLNESQSIGEVVFVLFDGNTFGAYANALQKIVTGMAEA